MLQWSVYGRICKGISDVEKHASRLKKILPEYGSVRMLIVTEKQYAGMEVLVGKQKKEEILSVFALLEL